MTLEELKVIISADTSRIKKGLKNVQSQLSGFNSSMNETKKKISSVFSGKQTDGLNQKLVRQNENIKKQQNLLIELQKKYDRLLSGNNAPKAVIQMQKELKRVSSELDKAVEKNITLGQNMDELKYKGDIEKQIGGKYSPQTQFQINNLSAELRMGEAEIENLRAKAEKLKEELKKAKLNPENSDEAQKLSRDIEFATEKLERLKSEAGATSTKIEGIGRSSSKGLESIKRGTEKTKRTLSQFANRMKSIIMGAFVFNVVSQGLTKLREYLSSVMKTNQQFSKSLAQIKGNLLTAFQPIFSAVTPALQNMVNWLAKATAQIAAFISALFGTTFKQSQQAAEDLNNQVEDIKKASKEAVSATAGFDELNIISKQQDTYDSGTINSTKPDFSMDIDTSKAEGLAGKIREMFKLLTPVFEGFSDTIKGFYDTYLYKWLVKIGDWLKEHPEAARKIGEIAAKISLLVLAFKGIKWLGEVTGITKLVKWLAKLVTGSNNVTGAFKRKNKSLDEQTKKTGLEYEKVFALVGVFGLALEAIKALKKWLDSNPFSLPNIEFPIPELVPQLRYAFETAREFLKQNALSIPPIAIPAIELIPKLSEVWENAKEWFKNNRLSLPEISIPSIGLIPVLSQAFQYAREWMVNNNISIPQFNIPELNLIPMLNNAFNNAWQNITTFANNTSSSLSMWAYNVGSIVSAVASVISGSIYQGLSNAATNIVTWLNGTIQGFATWGINMVQIIGESVSGMIDAFVDGLSNMWTNFCEFCNSTGEKIGQWWQANKSWVIPTVAITAITIGAIALAPATGGTSLGALAFAKNGGFPEKGQLFVAREAGPEMVGSINGKTAVANNSQIVSAVSAGVAKAVSKVIPSGGETTVLGGEFRIKGNDLVYVLNRTEKARGAKISKNFAHGGV